MNTHERAPSMNVDQKLWNEVERIQKDFKYTKVCNDESDRVKIWKCANPKDNNLCFEIVIGSFGIYVGGDMDCLSFRVDRDLGFLAGNDVNYYIYSKLESIFREQSEFRQDLADQIVANYMVNYLKDEADLLDLTTNVTDNDDDCDELLDRVHSLNDNSNLETVVSIYKELGLDDEYEVKPFDYYKITRRISNADEFYSLSCKYDDYCYDSNVSGPCKSVMFRLYMVCHAARRIIEQESALTV
jgi:hypothetical protein